MRRVVCAALRNENLSVICGARHFDAIMRRQLTASSEPWDDVEQGFIDQHGIFLTREEAFQVAFDAGQIIRRVGGDTGKLFSENLY